MEASSYDALVASEGSQRLLLVTMVCCILIQERVQRKCGGLICSQPCLPPIQCQSVQMTLCIDISFDALQLISAPWPSCYSYAALVQLTTSLTMASGILPKPPWVSFPSGELFSVECKCHIQCGSLQYELQLLLAAGKLESNSYVSIVACVLRKLSSSFSEVHSIDADYGPNVVHISIVPLAWDPGAESIIHDPLLLRVARSFQLDKLFRFVRHTHAVPICRYSQLHEWQQLEAMIWCWSIVSTREGIILVFHLLALKDIGENFERLVLVVAQLHFEIKHVGVQLYSIQLSFLHCCASVLTLGLGTSESRLVFVQRISILHLFLITKQLVLLATGILDRAQICIQYDSKRPSGVVTMIFGIDAEKETTQLFACDPVGYFFGHKAARAGQREGEVVNLLQKKMCDGAQLQPTPWPSFSSVHAATWNLVPNSGTKQGLAGFYCCLVKDSLGT